MLTVENLFVDYVIWKEKNGEKKEEQNKAGYTANTSCGRVGRGGNARFHIFQHDHYGQTDGQSLL